MVFLHVLHGSESGRLYYKVQPCVSKASRIMERDHAAAHSCVTWVTGSGRVTVGSCY